jgi:hypothetical protein
VRLAAFAADEPFLFYTGASEKQYTGTMAWGVKAFMQTIETIDLKSIEFHAKRGDFAKWAEKSLRDPCLADELKKVTAARLEGEHLRKTLLKVVKRRLNDLNAEIQSAIRYF